MMHEPNNAIPDNIRALLDKLSSDELTAVGRYLMQERGIDPYAYLDDAQREKLHAAIDRGIAQADAGQTRPLSEVLAELQRHR